MFLKFGLVSRFYVRLLDYKINHKIAALDVAMGDKLIINLPLSSVIM